MSITTKRPHKGGHRMVMHHKSTPNVANAQNIQQDKWHNPPQKRIFNISPDK